MSSAGKNRQRLGYRRIVQLLVGLVIVPTVLLLSLGIILMFLERAQFNLIFGILTVSFVAVVALGVILVLVFVQREATLSELQADFVSKVSHELKTPLTAIRLFAETLHSHRGDEATAKKCLQQILDESDRLHSKIERLLNWGRMEAGRKIYDLKLESLASVVEEGIRAYPPIHYGSVEFHLDIETGVGAIRADRNALVDAIVNLLSNAHKYGGSPPKIWLRVYAQDGHACVAVRDNGSGIPRPEHKRIFQKFYRIDDRLARAKEGSGLGLAIVDHITRAHAGSIRLESKEGDGSTFTLRFPLQVAADASVSKAAEVVP